MILAAEFDAIGQFGVEVSGEVEPIQIPAMIRILFTRKMNVIRLMKTNYVMIS